jgi:hypothetical protein
MLNHNLGNPRFSKIKMLSVDPLINNLSLLLLPHTKAQSLHLYQQSLTAKTTHYYLSEPSFLFRVAPLWNLIAGRIESMTFVRSRIFVWKGE